MSQIQDIQGAPVALNRGMVAYVDMDDVERVTRYQWRVTSEGYATAQVDGRTTYMHHFILLHGGCDEVDHKDQNRLNNCKSNLRPATCSQNKANRPKPKPKLNTIPTSRYKGVSLSSSGNTWRGQVVCNGVVYHRTFRSENDAARFYNEKAVELFGEFAFLNVILPDDRVLSRPEHSYVCGECGKSFTSIYSRVGYCSDECRRPARSRRAAAHTRETRRKQKLANSREAVA